MTSVALRIFANSLISQHTAVSKYKREAAFSILEKASTITDFVSDEDKINQAANYYLKVWKDAFELTNNPKFKTYIVVAKQSLNQMATFNEVEHLISEKYDNFNELLDYVKQASWSNRISYSTLKEVYSIMELNHGA